MIENGRVGGSDEVSPSEFEAARIRLRQRWELACVLNFFKVFEPVIESNMKISAEDVEAALILPNKSLAQLHIVLLKGIPPVSKNLKDPDAWVVALSKKLATWWPWVAEGDFPLTAAKGTEMATYKGLDPTIRLTILKALCEIRADQYDVVSYINTGVKTRNELSTFRKNKIGEDGKGISYWWDGNEIIGFRLYKETNTSPTNGVQPAINCQWETIATNREEFQKVMDEFSSSKSKLEVAVSKVVGTEVIPVLDKLHKKKQRAIQQMLREKRLIDSFCRSGVTRSCRNRKRINYTFDEYDKAIDAAIRETKKRKTKEEPRNKKKENPPNGGGSSEKDDESRHGGSTEEENESESRHGNSTEEEEEESHKDVSEDESKDSGESDNSNKENTNLGSSNRSSLDSQSFENKTRGTEKISASPNKSFGAKKQLRQRPNRNTAAVVSDSDDG